MKIAYVSYNLMEPIINGGVGRKIKSCIDSWHKLGHEAGWFTTCSTPFVEQCCAFVFDKTKNFLLREKDRSLQLKLLVDAVTKYKPDIIYLRSGVYTYPLERLFNVAPVIIELNTLDLIEYKKRGRPRYYLHLATRDCLYNRAAGFVAVSNEIAEINANAKYKKPILVLGNGIDLNRYKTLPARKKEKPRLVFIGTMNIPWHGLDKIVFLAEKMPNIVIDIIGIEQNELSDRQLPRNIYFHGFKKYEEYLSIIERADVGIGTLALHRKHMGEASPLKVREYLAHGLPVIIGFKDTDLSDKRLKFILELPNIEHNIANGLKQIAEFISEMKGTRVKREQISHLLDLKVKEEIRLNYFRQIIERRRTNYC